MCPNYHVIKATQVERYLSNDKILIQEYLVEVDLHALMDKAASRIIMAKKMPYIFLWAIFRKSSFSFQNGVAMEAPNTTHRSNRR
jgi:hypothetical protein